MNILYEEDGAFKIGSVMTDNVTSLQVEALHGKRSKIKADKVLLKFEVPLSGFMEAAQAIADDIELDFLWECCGTEEIGFADMARDYCGHAPSPAESAGLLLKLHSAPMYFYRKGKGRFKAAPEENLKAALAGEEKKRRQAEQVASYVAQLTAGKLPAEFTAEVVDKLLYQPDKNTLECKALLEACETAKQTPVKLLDQCGAIPSSHDYHLNRFQFEWFPRGPGFAAYGPLPELPAVPLSDALAFSIDDAATTEIDDAFSVKRLANGNWRIGVHIAAPALAIPPESPLDLIAAQRLSTVYMPGHKITMLPDEVVALFTLGENSRCPALSMYLEVSPELEILNEESRVDHVEIAANLRHDTLEPVFNEETVVSEAGDYPFKDELLLLWRFATKLKEGRGKADGQRMFPDYNFSVENDRISISERERDTPIDRVVSELMIHVNSQWGKRLADAGISAIYRSQEGGKVRMSTTPAPHQGLGVAHYMWSSSPLRRYIDLLNQRQLLAALLGEEPAYPPRSDKLFATVRDFELAYDAYSNIQRHMERYWCLRWLIQEGIAECGATIAKESTVKLDGAPLFTRVPSLPQEFPAGTRIVVEASAIDLLDMEFSCKFKSLVEE
ncbi:MAG: RNB domain-containing ribonuclease [Sulfuricella sp.]|nr:RNB domain-containing ribonuclease [Sulfuricella sp.]